MSMSAKWIGREFGAFRRVSLAFNQLGFNPPRPDYGSGGKGAYVMNIVRQYQADLSPDQAMAIIRYGLNYPIASPPSWTLQEIFSLYNED